MTQEQLNNLSIGQLIYPNKPQYMIKKFFGKFASSTEGEYMTGDAIGDAPTGGSIAWTIEENILDNYEISPSNLNED